MKLLSDKIFFLFLFFPLLTHCPTFNKTAPQLHCSQYTYNESTNQWTDALGNNVTCSIVDHKKIFPYYPDTGCDHWIKSFQLDSTVKFVEVPIRTGNLSSPLLQTYCVKQRYVEVDHSGQVLLIDQGAFCLKEHEEQEKEYVFSTCQGIYRKRKEDPSQKVTDPKKA